MSDEARKALTDEELHYWASAGSASAARAGFEEARHLGAGVVLLVAEVQRLREEADRRVDEVGELVEIIASGSPLRYDPGPADWACEHCHRSVDAVSVPIDGIPDAHRMEFPEGPFPHDTKCPYRIATAIRERARGLAPEPEVKA